MRKFIVEGNKLPAWTAPISHAVVVDRLCFVSGQLSIDANGHYVPGSAGEEAVRAFHNVLAALHHAGFAPEEVSFVQIDFSDLADIGEVNAVFADLFAMGRRPARTADSADVDQRFRPRLISALVLTRPGGPRPKADMSNSQPDSF